ncbi:MAG: type II toxin-antitoxin system RelE/ParE family toxin [Deltaproteobacteria bacterium]|nr:type II toxin-antitoxin system RelE/ParE family toxin [Deltaproteobacteria bacterium]
MRYASVLVTAGFRDSVDEILAWIAARNPQRAASVADELLDRAGSLDEMARRGRMVPEAMDDNLRELLVIKNEYRMIYRVDDARSIVEILVLWPARKPLQLDKLLDGE